VLRIIGANWQVVLRGILMSSLTTTTFYLITAYTPTFGKQVLGFADRDNLIVTLCVGFSNLFWLPVGGTISDRIGRRPMLLALTAATIVTAYPAMSWLISAPSFSRLLVVQLWFSFIFGMYNGAMIPFLTEIMPPLVRTSGFALAFSCATALFGGMTPLISTWLIQQTGNRAIPGAWLTIPAILALIASILSRPYTEPVGAAARAPAE
jgi:MFS transporter, MHS family, citrate/tricarballylate:H+ symporter